MALSKQEQRIEDRWEAGTPHQDEAKQIARAIAEYMPNWDIKFGGDGDAGEYIQLALSLWIEDGKPNLVPEWDK